MFDALDDLEDHDPYRAGDSAPGGKYGHLFVVAVPRRASPSLAEDLIWDRGDELMRLVGPAHGWVRDDLRSWGPALMGFGMIPHARSVSLTNLFPSRLQEEGEERYGIDIRIGASGAMGLTVTRISESGGRPEENQVLDGTILGNIWHLISWVRQVADLTGYTGSWDLGLRADGLSGKSAASLEATRFARRDRVTYDEDVYKNTGTFSREQLDDAPGVVIGLAKPLLRGLGSWTYWQGGLTEQ